MSVSTAHPAASGARGRPDGSARPGIRGLGWWVAAAVALTVGVGSIPLAVAVVGGTAAPRVPSIARLSVKTAGGTGFYCTGTLVAPQVVASAASCAFDPQTGQPITPQQVQITLGETTQNTTTGVGDPLETHSATGAFVVAQLPAFTDVALFALDRPSTIAPMPIATTLPQPGTPTSFLGFGGPLTNGAVALSPQLRQGTAALTAANTCTTGGGAFLCLAPGGDQACFGDTGGPVIATVNGATSMIGVISSGARLDTGCTNGTTAASMPQLKGLVDNFATLTAAAPQLVTIPALPAAVAVTGRALAVPSVAILVPTTTLTRIGVAVTNYITQLVQPQVVQPIVVQPIVVQPLVVQPQVVQVQIVRPQIVRPWKSGMTMWQAAPVRPPAGQPQPPVNQPPVNQPPTYQPPVNQPPTYQPPVYLPPTYQPPVYQPPTYQPPVNQPPVNQQPAAQPPAAQPPAERSPVDQQPAAQPPADRPPADQQPAAQPPAAQPPAAQPPAAQPPAAQPPAARPQAAQPDQQPMAPAQAAEPPTP